MADSCAGATTRVLQRSTRRLASTRMITRHQRRSWLLVLLVVCMSGRSMPPRSCFRLGFGMQVVAADVFPLLHEAPRHPNDQNQDVVEDANLTRKGLKDGRDIEQLDGWHRGRSRADRNLARSRRRREEGLAESSHSYVEDVDPRAFIESRLEQDVQELSLAEQVELLEMIGKAWGSQYDARPLEEHPTGCRCTQHLPGSVQHHLKKAQSRKKALDLDTSESGDHYKGGHVRYKTKSQGDVLVPRPRDGGGSASSQNPSAKSPNGNARIYLPFRFDYSMTHFGIVFVGVFVIIGLLTIATVYATSYIRMTNWLKVHKDTAGPATKSARVVSPSRSVAPKSVKSRRVSVDITKIDMI